MPDSIERLKNLSDLNFSSDFVPLDLRDRDSNEFLMILVQHCKSLFDIGGYEIELSKELEYALACNIARFRTGIGTEDKEFPQTTPKIWPRILNYATHAVDWYSHSSFNRPTQPYKIEKPDDIYYLLVDGRESFIRLLTNRNISNVISVGTQGAQNI